MAALPEEYRHEPEKALASGVDGLEATRTILNEAASHLNDRGYWSLRSAIIGTILNRSTPTCLSLGLKRVRETNLCFC